MSFLPQSKIMCLIHGWVDSRYLLQYSLICNFMNKCHRMLSVRELARAQGFPDDFEFVMLDGRVTTVRALFSLGVELTLTVTYL